MSFCPVPHTARDRTWLAIGVITGGSCVALALALSNRKTVSAETVQSRPSLPPQRVAEDEAVQPTPSLPPRRVAADDLKDFCIRTLVASGSAPENAEAVAKVLVCADLRGVTSHGVNRLELYCDELSRKAVDGTAKPTIERETDSVATVDAHNSQGMVGGVFCIELAIEKARKQGVGWVVLRHSNHYGIAGYYAMMAAEQGMMGFSYCNTSPLVVPTRAAKPALGTNPIACAGPVEGGPPVVLDMATPCAALGKVEVKYRNNQPCPPAWGVDKDGLSTTDPKEILFGGGLCPLGGAEESSGYKGYGLGLMVEMMCGVLGGTKCGPDIPQSMNPNALGRMELADLAQCFVVVNPAFFPDWYSKRLKKLTDQLRDLPTAENAPGKVLIPGDIERLRSEEQQKNKIELTEPIAQALDKLAERCKTDKVTWA